MKNQTLYTLRTERLVKLIESRAAGVIVAQECCLVIRAYGFWKWISYALRLRLTLLLSRP